MGPCCGPQAGKSWDPHSQDTDSSPRAQGALGLDFEAKPKGKCGAPRTPIANGPAPRVAIDWTWASPRPHAASATARPTKGWRGQRLPSLLSFVLLQIPFLAPCFRNLQICFNPLLSFRPMVPRKAMVVSPPAWYEPALDAPNVSEKNLAAMRLLTAGENIEKGKTELRAGSAEPEASKSTFYPFFMSSVVVGLVPPSLTSSMPSSVITGCRPSIFIPNPFFSCRSLPSTVRRMSG